MYVHIHMIIQTNDKIMKSYLKIKCTRISVCLLTFYDYDTYA